MRVLIDECVPRKFKFSIASFGHECSTVPDAGLAGKQNGELLSLAEDHFDVFITLDKGIEYQQNLASRKLSIIVIRAKSNRFIHVSPFASRCDEIIRSIQPAQLVMVGS